MRAFKHAESLKRHELKEVFSDVYGGEEPLNLVGVLRSSPPLLPLPQLLARCDRKNSYTSPCVYRRNNGRSLPDCSESTGPRGDRGKRR